MHPVGPAGGRRGVNSNGPQESDSRSANDIIETSGVKGRIPVSSLVQLIYVKDNKDDCQHCR
eukprot:8524765-Pyramimonas_sp.AAC.2